MGETGQRDLYRPRHAVRFVTAASLFDGHDAAINIMRRLLQAQGAEVIHLGHNRSVHEVVEAALQEDVQGVALSSYQGGHLEYFKYLVDRLREAGRADIKIFGGGGGVIIPEEIKELEDYGVTKIFSPSDGQHLGLELMVNQLIESCDVDLAHDQRHAIDELILGNQNALARVITAIEADTLTKSDLATIAASARAHRAPVLGITGTGGAGKSSLTDELLVRFRLDQGNKLRIAVIAVDPTKRRSGGALLGDRIRMNSLESGQIFFRSLATRASASEVPTPVPTIVEACRAAGYDLIIIETPGIGQGDAAIVDVADLSLYVMTPEFGAATQLEKIDMLDLADVIAINKFDRHGSADALRSVSRQWHRGHPGGGEAPVFGTVAAHFNDEGTTALYQYLRDALGERGLTLNEPRLSAVTTRVSPATSPIIPSTRVRYLAEIADTLRHYHAATETQASLLRDHAHVAATRTLLADSAHEATGLDELDELEATTARAIAPESRALLERFYARRQEIDGDFLAGPSGATPLTRTSMSGTTIRRVTLPRLHDQGDLFTWLRKENLPGSFPFTAGVFAFKRANEDPARMFAGEGDAARTNRRFHLLSEGQPATRLSTAFDSVTLYGRDPDTAPDVFGKVAPRASRSRRSTT